MVKYISNLIDSVFWFLEEEIQFLKFFAISEIPKGTLK